MKSPATKEGLFRLKKCLPVVCIQFGVTPEQILGKSRLSKISNARHSLRYFMSLTNNLSLAEIGTLTNGDHSSVIHSIKVFEVYSNRETQFKEFKAFVNKDKKYKKQTSIIEIDKKLRALDSYTSLSLGGKVNFIKDFIEQNEI
mgnify:CR=1 FL=1